MAKKKDVIKLIEGDKYFEMVNNYQTADIQNFQTPQHTIEQEINVTVEKIKVLTGAISLIDNSLVKTIMNEKIRTLKDCSESLIKISQIFSNFSNKMENKNATEQN